MSKTRLQVLEGDARPRSQPLTLGALALDPRAALLDSARETPTLNIPALRVIPGGLKSVDDWQVASVEGTARVVGEKGQYAILEGDVEEINYRSANLYALHGSETLAGFKLKLPKLNFKLPKIKFKLPKFKVSLPKFKFKLPKINFSKAFNNAIKPLQNVANVATGILEQAPDLLRSLLPGGGGMLPGSAPEDPGAMEDPAGFDPNALFTPPPTSSPLDLMTSLIPAITPAAPQLEPAPQYAAAEEPAPAPAPAASDDLMKYAPIAAVAAVGLVLILSQKRGRK